MKKGAVVHKDKSFRQVATRQMNPIVTKTDSSIVFEGEKKLEATIGTNSVEAASKMAVQKLPVSSKLKSWFKSNCFVSLDGRKCRHQTNGSNS